MHDSEPCNEVSSRRHVRGADAVFFHGGGIAYTCWGHVHLADGRGDRELEPAGTRVTQLGISRNGHGTAERLYYMVDDTTAEDGCALGQRRRQPVVAELLGRIAVQEPVAVIAPADPPGLAQRAHRGRDRRAVGADDVRQSLV